MLVHFPKYFINFGPLNQIKSMGQSIKDKAKNWAANHREFIIIAIALPMGKVASLIANFKEFLRKLFSFKSHDQKVNRILNEVQQYSEARKGGEEWAQNPMRTNRKGAASLNVRTSDKSNSNTIRMSDLNKILSVDEKAGTIRLEPFATVGQVAKHLNRKGLQLEGCIEMQDATLGGLVMALGMTTHSHICGLVHDTVTAYEIVTANGELIRATADNEHADLFRALPWSHGTLGLLVALEMRVIPAPSHIRLVYRPFYSLDKYAAEYKRIVESNDPPHFIETQIFGKDQAVIMEGHFASGEEVKSGKLRINRINLYYKPLFFKHVESMLELGEGKSFDELIPTYHYHMRHDRSMCMTLGQILPTTANKRWFRYTMGWMLPPNMTFLKGSRPQAQREESMRRQVWQEFAFPAEHFAELVADVHDSFEIYPLLAYPCKTIDKGGIVQIPALKGKAYSGKPQTQAYLDIGIYGIPQRVKDGDEKFPAVTKVRKLEEKVRSLGGFLHTYCDVFSTEEEFNEMFDLTLWKEMRNQYEADGAFPSIYQKVKPEMDPLAFLEEEQSWLKD